MAEEVPQRRVVRFGVFDADLRTGELRRQGIRVRLHGRPFELLAALLERPGQVVTREELRQRLWAGDTFVDFDHGLNNAVNRIRRALGDTAGSPRFIETLPRRGYRFIAPVEPVGDVGAEPVAAAPQGWWAQAAVAAACLLVLAGVWMAGQVGLVPATDPVPSQFSTPAYQAYLKGRYHQNKGGPASWAQARQFFDAAVRLDPALAPALAALAGTLNRLGAVGALPPHEARPAARAYAEEALRLDPGLAEAHVALGTANLLMHWDWTGAERAYRRAIALEPDRSEAHWHYALLLAAMGRPAESLAEIAEARRLNPLDVSIHADAGRVLYLARRYDDAIVHLRQTLELEPQHPLALRVLSDAYLRKDMRHEAGVVFGRLLEALGVEETERRIAVRLLGEGGLRQLARRALSTPAGTAQDTFGAPMKLAVNHAAIGDRDRALEWLERAFRQRDPRLVFLKVDPDFDTLRGDARFARLLRDVGL